MCSPDIVQRLGRDFDAITRSANYNIAIGRDDKEVQDRLDWVLDHQTKLVGAEKAEAQLQAYRGHARGRDPRTDRGEALRVEDGGDDLRHRLLPELADDTSGLELFEKEVIPALA